MGKQTNAPLGFWASLIRQIRLAWRLFWDPRVPGWTKLVPILSVIYILSPIDFIPDFLIGVGQVDDIGALGALLVGIKMLVDSSPQAIVIQHLADMGFPVGEWEVAEWVESDEEAPVIDAEYEVEEE